MNICRNIFALLNIPQQKDQMHAQYTFPLLMCLFTAQQQKHEFTFSGGSMIDDTWQCWYSSEPISFTSCLKCLPNTGNFFAEEPQLFQIMYFLCQIQFPPILKMNAVSRTFKKNPMEYFWNLFVERGIVDQDPQSNVSFNQIPMICANMRNCNQGIIHSYI